MTLFHMGEPLPSYWSVMMPHESTRGRAEREALRQKRAPMRARLKEAGYGGDLRCATKEEGDALAAKITAETGVPMKAYETSPL